MTTHPPALSVEIQPQHHPQQLDMFLFPLDTPFVVVYGVYVDVCNRSWVSIEPPSGFERVPINLVPYDEFQLDMMPIFEPEPHKKIYYVLSEEIMEIEKKRQYKHYCQNERKYEGLIFKGLLDVPEEGAELQIVFRGQRRHLRRLELYYGRRLGDTLAQDKLEVSLLVA